MGIEITEGGQAHLDAMARRSGGGAVDEAQFTPGFVDHDPAEGQPAGGAGLAWFWARFGESFSDLDREVLETVATADHLVTVMALSGTHTGDYQGHPPTGRRFTVRNVQVIRFEDGRMAERWGSTDEQGILRQLGLG